MTEKTSWLRARPAVLRSAEYQIVTWHHTVPAGTPLAEVMKPDFWAHVSKQLRPQHRIVVDWEDAVQTATLYVRSAQRASAAVALLSHVEFTGAVKHAPAALDESAFEVAWGGPAHKHRVVRKSDKSVMKHGFDTAEQAALWVKNHIQAAA